MSKKNNKISNDIINFYENDEVKKLNIDHPNPNFELNQMKLSMMMLLIGATGAGKTNCLLNILKRFDNTFSHIYICNQEQEPLYEFLKIKLKDKITIVQKLSDLPDLKTLGQSKTEQKLFVFDDMVKVKDQTYIDTLFLRGRKMSCNCIYISQSFFDTPLFLRKQLHYLILLKISGDRDLKLILSNYQLGVTQDKLLELYKNATSTPMSFLKIDIRTGDENKKFSKNFTEFYDL
jgi:hypothetical protein